MCGLGTGQEVEKRGGGGCGAKPVWASAPSIRTCQSEEQPAEDLCVHRSCV